MEIFWILLLIFLVSLISYLFGAYCLYRIGKKFGVGSFIEFCIPIYNLYLLNKCANLSTGFLFIHLIPGVGSLIWVTVAYGRIAERLGKNFWLYGLGSFFLLGIPFLIMVFDRSMPIGTAPVNGYHRDSYQKQPFSNNVPLSSTNHTLPSTDHKFIGSTAFLVGTAGIYKEAVIPIPAEGIVIGRDPTYANLILENIKVSSAHARIALHPTDYNRVIVEDLGSTNGTFIFSHTNSDEQWTPVSGKVEFTTFNVTKLRLGHSEEIFEITNGGAG